MVSQVFKVFKRLGDIRYNGTLDTCAYFDFRRMASGLLSCNTLRCLWNCLESTILVACGSKHSISATSRVTRYEQCGVSVAAGSTRYAHVRYMSLTIALLSFNRYRIVDPV